MEQEFAELMVTSGQVETEMVIAALQDADIIAFAKRSAHSPIVTAPMGLFDVMVDATRLEDAKRIVSLGDGCECQQEDDNGEDQAAPDAVASSDTGVVE
jgi:hypothetical protein